VFSRGRIPANMTILMLGALLELGLYRAEYLKTHGHHVIFPKSQTEAIGAIKTGQYDAVVLSYSLSDKTAVEFRELIEQACPSCPVITLTEKRWYDQKIPSERVVLVSDGPQGLLEAVESVQVKSGIRLVK
jgi:DNA-binding NtrC family response regulator